jgi:hypothetical protein
MFDAAAALQTEGTKEEMDDGGDELTMYLVLSWTWEICLPAYTLYMAYSYYMEIHRGQRIGLMYGRLAPLYRLVFVIVSTSSSPNPNSNLQADRGALVGVRYPDMLDYLDPNAIPMEHYVLPPPGQLVSMRGHCSECYEARHRPPPYNDLQ